MTKIKTATVLKCFGDDIVKRCHAFDSILEVQLKYIFCQIAEIQFDGRMTKIA